MENGEIRYFVFENPQSRPYGNPENFRQVSKGEAFQVCDSNEEILVIETRPKKLGGLEISVLSYLGADVYRNPDYNLVITSDCNEIAAALAKVLSAVVRTYF